MWIKKIGTILCNKGVKKKKEESWAKGKGIHIHNDGKSVDAPLKLGTNGRKSKEEFAI